MPFPLSQAQSNWFEFLPETGSTNKDLLALAAKEALPDFSVLVTDFQSAGRGRMDRSWEAPKGSSIMASLLLRPKFQDQAGYGWLSLMVALAIKEVIADLSETLPVGLKWPNDILIDNKKVSGVLAEATPDLGAVVIGFGLNLSQQQSELPVPEATSLLLAGSRTLDRDEILSRILIRVRSLYESLAASFGDAQRAGLRDQVIAASSTIGQKVAIHFPDQSQSVGLAIDIDPSGRLIVESQGKQLSVSAADIAHLRSA
jgi:BirA family transcriptional regulator, biotin operon repressor / biotin---[acetyl-CoA-carboxylase] ligase